MSLRIKIPSKSKQSKESGDRDLQLPAEKRTNETRAVGDDWSSRLVKLLPAEALSLYGTGQAMIPDGKREALFILAVFCILFTGLLRYNATREKDGHAQYGAIAIAIFSFVLWLLTLPSPAGPVDLGSHRYIAALAALTWTTILPTLYKGD